MDFPYTLKIRDRELKFRSWKVQDKINLENAKTIYDKRKALVYNCLENPNIALDMNEYQYVLLQIRNKTLKHYEVQYNFICSKCYKEYAFIANLDDIIKPEFKPYSVIKTKNYTIELQDICNQNFYESLMQDIENSDIEDKANQKILMDFILHIKTFNNDINFNTKSILDIINNMDVEEFENIMIQYNDMKFKLNNISTIQCPYCEHKETVQFDTIPNFFPISWTNLLSDLQL